MECRDRAGGWKHAKLSGHSNESLIKKLLDTDKVYLPSLLERMGYDNEIVVETSIGGLHGLYELHSILHMLKVTGNTGRENI